MKNPASKFVVARSITKRQLVGLLKYVDDDDELTLESYYEGRVIELNVEVWTPDVQRTEYDCIWRAEK